MNTVFSIGHGYYLSKTKVGISSSSIQKKFQTKNLLKINVKKQKLES